MRRHCAIVAMTALIFVGSTSAKKSKPKTQLSAAASSLDALLDSTRKSIVQIRATSTVGQATTDSFGTGFVVSPDGIIVTCNHVVANAASTGNETRWSYHQQIQATMPDGSKEPATVLGTLSAERVLRDYALLKINRKTPAYLTLGDFSEMKTGDDLIAWGFPFGLPGPVLIKASVATTVVESSNGVNIQAVVFQGPNNKGMSGGPVILNRTGHVLGITSNRIAGIGKELDETRQYIRSIQGSGSVRLMGVDPNAAIVALTDTLDKFLMSGMGVAISVENIKRELPAAK